ncbi:MAG: type IV-A pilus assembly ATPase PilB, partial [Gammaproteobacteria bacterium]
MAVSANKIHLSGLARKLVLDGLLDEASAADHYQKALGSKQAFVAYLVENKLVPARDIAIAASQEFGVPVLDINAMEIDIDVIKLIKEDLIRKHHSLPIFKRGKRLYIAVSDPTNLQALDEIKFATSTNTEAILVEEDKLAKIIDKSLEEMEGGLGDMDEDELDNLEDLEVADETKADTGLSEAEIDDAPV